MLNSPSYAQIDGFNGSVSAAIDSDLFFFSLLSGGFTTWLRRLKRAAHAGDTKNHQG